MMLSFHWPTVGHWDFEGSVMADNLEYPYNRRRVLEINDLPDDDLLAIFDFYVFKIPGSTCLSFSNDNTKREIESWKTLVHVCRRWRALVFESPSRLNLQLCCLTRRSAGMSLDIWPTLPLLILGIISDESMDNVTAKLKHHDRIRQIQIHFDRYIAQMDSLWTTMQVPLPKLEVLCLSFGDWWHREPVLPDLFLGGCAPRLQRLTLSSISFPALPNLLLSATHLVQLRLTRIPHDSKYASPEAMATYLPMLTSLKSFQLGFKYPQLSPDQESRHPRPRPPPPPRFVLPSLTKFSFEGVNKYFEDLVSRIDAPRLNQLLTSFFDGSDLDFPELNRFIGSTPRLWAYNETRLTIHSGQARVRLQSHIKSSDLEMVEFKFSFQMPDRQLSSLAKICTSSLRHLLTMEKLYIYENGSSPRIWGREIENVDWLDFLLPFTAVKNLYLSKKFVPYIAPALQVLTGGRTTEVLPALQKVLLEGFLPWVPLEEGIAQFISARQLTDYPVTISVWEDNDFL